MGCIGQKIAEILRTNLIYSCELLKLNTYGEHISHEPFVFPSQVQQVFYVQDPSKSNCFVALNMTPRDGFKLGDNSTKEENVMSNCVDYNFPLFDENLDDDASCPTWVHTDGCRGITIKTK